MARLVYVDRHGRERGVTLGAECPRVTVGRNPDCVIHTTKPSVSRLHSEFTWTHGVYEVTDLQSSNGTFINSREIRRQNLQDRDEVKCGDFVIRFFLDDGEALGSGQFPKESPRPVVPPPFDSVSGPPRPTSPVEQANLQQPTGYHRGGNSAPPVPSNLPGTGNFPPAPPGPYQEGYPGEADPYQRPYSGVGSGAYPHSGRVPPLSQPQPTFMGAMRPSPLSPVDPGDMDRLQREIQDLREKVADQEAIIDYMRDESPGGKSQGDAEALNREVESLKVENATLRRERDEVLSAADGSTSRVAELERELARNLQSLDAFQARYELLREQSDGQRKQLEHLRGERQQHLDAIAEMEAKVRDLERSTSNRESEKHNLLQVNADLQIKVSHLERQFEEASRASSLADFELKKARQEAESLRVIVNSGGTEKQDLEQELGQLRLVLEAKEASIVTQERRIEALDADMERLRAAARDNSEREALEAELAQRQTQIDGLEVKLQALRDALEEAQAASRAGESLNKDLEALRKELEALRASAVPEDEAQAMQEEIDRLRQASRQAARDLEEVTARRDALQTLCDDAERARAQSQARVEQLQAELAEALAEVEGAATGRKKLESDIEGVRQVLGEREGALAEAEAALARARQESSASASQDAARATLKADLDMAVETVEALTAERSDLLARIAARTTERDEIAAELGALQHRIEALEAELVEAREAPGQDAGRDTLQSRVQALEAERAELEAALEDFDGIQDELDAAEAERDAAKAERDAATAAREALKGDPAASSGAPAVSAGAPAADPELAIVRSERDDALEALDALQSQLDALQARLDGVSPAAGGQPAASAEGDAALAARVKALEEEKADLELAISEIDGLYARIDALEAERVRLLAGLPQGEAAEIVASSGAFVSGPSQSGLRAASGDESVDALQSENEALTLAVEALEGEMRLLREALGVLEAERAAASAQGASTDVVEALRRERAEIAEELELLRAQAAEAAAADQKGHQEAIEAMEAELAQARGQIEALAEQARSAATSRDALEADLAEARGQIDELVEAYEEAESSMLLARAEAAASSQQLAAHGAGGRDKAMETYQSLNDVVATLRNNMTVAQGYVADLRKVYDALRKADLKQLSTLDRVRLEKTMRETEPEVTLDELHNLIGGAAAGTEDMRGSLRSFKQAFDPEGPEAAAALADEPSEARPERSPETMQPAVESAAGELTEGSQTEA